MFTINGKLWRVLFVDPRHSMLLKPDGTYAIGACDDNSNCIYLSNQLTGGLLRKVLCHEITHAMMFSYNITMSRQQEELFAELMSKYGKNIIELTEKELKRKGRI